MKIAIIGAGNGGQAMAGYLASIGCEVSVYDRNSQKIDELNKKGGIYLKGRINDFGRIRHFTTIISEAILNANIILVTTTANAHQEVAHAICPYIEDEQIILLNPGRTCGALVFKNTLELLGCKKRYFLGETQTLVYACRVVENGVVNIIGVKDEVLLSGLPASDTRHILLQLNQFYPCLKSAKNILQTGFENIGAIFHPCVCLFNAATIERQTEFWFYRDMTTQVARFIEKFDAERIAIGKAYGFNLLNVTEWIKFAYNNTRGETLCERMINNPAYYEIKAPGTIFTRQLIEDIPTGVLPLLELGRVANVSTPLLNSMVHIIENLLEMDLHTNGRTLVNMGLSNMSKENIIKYIENGC